MKVFAQILILSIIILTSFGCTKGKPSNTQLEKQGFKVTEKKYRTIAQKEGQYLVIHNKKSKSILTQNTEMLEIEINSIYIPPRAPYPGFISDKIECSKKEFLPKKISFSLKSIEFIGHTMFSNSKRNIGACDKKDAHYLTHSGFIILRNKDYFYRVIFHSDPQAKESFKDVLFKLQESL